MTEGVMKKRLFVALLLCVSLMLLCGCRYKGDKTEQTGQTDSVISDIFAADPVAFSTGAAMLNVLCKSHKNYAENSPKVLHLMCDFISKKYCKNAVYNV